MKKNTIDRNFYRKLGDMLYEERKKRGYSLRYVAELTGISRTTIGNYENGNARIDKVRYKKICEALQMPKQIHIKIALGQREYEQKGNDNVKRKVIDLNTTKMTFEEIMNLKDYVWKNDILIPAEIIEGE